MTYDEFVELCKKKLEAWMDNPGDMTLSIKRVADTIEEIMSDNFPTKFEDVVVLANSDPLLEEVKEETEDNSETEIIKAIQEQAFEDAFPELMSHFNSEIGGNEPDSSTFGFTMSRGMAQQISERDKQEVSGTRTGGRTWEVPLYPPNEKKPKNAPKQADTSRGNFKRKPKKK